MPIYEYHCAKCGDFEVTQRITEDPLKRCPTCRGKVKKLISSTSFQLKGSGWYQTDYGSKKSSGKSEGSEKPAAGGESGDGASSAGEPKSADAPAAKEKASPEKKAAKSKRDTSAQAA